MTAWNAAEALCHFAAGALAERPALVHDDLVISYRELKRRCSGIASFLLAQGLPAGAHVGHYLYNSNAYMEACLGAAMAGMTHVNVNYRYRDDELLDLCNSLDVRVLVYDAAFTDRVERIRQRLRHPCVLLQVGGADLPAGAHALESLYDAAPEDFQSRASGDDYVIIATGGTTGLPKGVQWRQEDMWRKQKASTGVALLPLELSEHPATMEEHVRNVERLPPAGPLLILSPLMHGAGLLMALLAVSQGTPVATLGGERFDAERALDMIVQHGVGGVVLVGDAFALPLAEAVERRGPEQPLATLQMVVSSGSVLTGSCKAVFEKHRPGLVVFDSLGSSEASGYAVATGETGVFRPHPGTRVLDDQLRDVTPGSATVGIAYAGGYLPVGYYNAPQQTAETFVEIDGRRYVKTGDRCTVRDDGMLVLLGRDSTVVNTGGEKVYTVEVERVLLEHPAIDDAVVIGLPHERFGKQVAAIVEGAGLGEGAIAGEDIKAFVAEYLAGYKVPRLIFAIDSMQRAANGKPDYPFLTDYAERCLGKT